MKWKITAIVLITVILTFVGLAILGATVFDEDYTYEETASFSSEPEPIMSEEAALDEFMSGCNSDGDMNNYCRCVWAELRATMTINEIAKAGIEYNETGNIPQVMYDAADVCLGTESI
jgi:hypothetical protein